VNLYSAFRDLHALVTQAEAVNRIVSENCVKLPKVIRRRQNKKIAPSRKDCSESDLLKLTFRKIKLKIKIKIGYHHRILRQRGSIYDTYV